MHAKSFRFAIVLIVAAAASAQTPAAAEKVFHFTHITTPQGFQEVTNAVRAITEIQQAAIVNESKALAVRGTPAQISMAEWLFRALDQPAGATPPAKLEYAVPGTANELIRVFHVKHSTTPQGLQEVVNSVRSISEVQRIIVCNAPGAIAARGTGAQMGLVAWLIEAVDKPAGGGPYVSQSQTLTAPEFRLRDGSASVAQIFYPAHVVTPQHRQESLNMIRSITEMQRAVAVNTPGAIVVRGTAEQVALAGSLLDALAR